MENELNELKQLQQHASAHRDESDGSLEIASNEIFPDLPADACEEAVNEKVGLGGGGWVGWGVRLGEVWGRG